MAKYLADRMLTAAMNLVKTKGGAVLRVGHATVTGAASLDAEGNRSTKGYAEITVTYRTASDLRAHSATGVGRGEDPNEAVEAALKSLDRQIR